MNSAASSSPCLCVETDVRIVRLWRYGQIMVGIQAGRPLPRVCQCQCGTIRHVKTSYMRWSVIHLLSVPFGTVLGVYGLWVLLQRETEALFRRA